MTLEGARIKAYPADDFHIDIAQVNTEHGKLHLFIAIDGTSEFAFVRWYEKTTRRIAAAFLHDLVAAVPHTIYPALTDNRMQFTDTWPANDEAEAQAAAHEVEPDQRQIHRCHRRGPRRCPDLMGACPEWHHESRSDPCRHLVGR